MITLYPVSLSAPLVPLLLISQTLNLSVMFVSLPLCQFSVLREYDVPFRVFRCLLKCLLGVKTREFKKLLTKVIIRWLMMVFCFYFAADDKIKGCMEHTWGCYRLPLLQFCHQTYWQSTAVIFLWNNSVTWKRSGQQRSCSIFWACKFMIIKYLLYRASGTRKSWGWGAGLSGWGGWGEEKPTHEGRYFKKGYIAKLTVTILSVRVTKTRTK